MASALAVPGVAAEAPGAATAPATGGFLPRVHVFASPLGAPPHAAFRSLFKTTSRGRHARDRRATASDPPPAF